MINPSNSISFLRGPLAFLFLIDNPFMRVSVIILAMITDGVDGYLARKYKFTSRFGAVLDPIMDKFFVLVVLSILFFEGRVSNLEMALMVSRDILWALFSVYILARGQYKTFTFISVRWSKITTALQFCVLILLAAGSFIPTHYFFPFPLFATLALLELINSSRQTAIK